MSYWAKICRWMTEDERKDLDALIAHNSSSEVIRLFIQAYLKRCFPAFVYMCGYRDLGEFHRPEVEKLGEFRYLKDEPYRKLWLWSRGFFKCQRIGTNVLTDKGYKKVEELTSSDKVYGLDESSLKIRQVGVKAVEVLGTDTIYRISTASGRKVEVNSKHPFNVNLSWVEAKDLRVGDRVGVSRVLNRNIILNHVYPKTARLIGYLTGDGGTSGNAVMFANADKEVLDEVAYLTSVHKGKLIYQSKYDYRLNGIQWVAKKYGLSGKLSKEKTVPSQIFRSSNESIAEFIGGLYDCDSTLKNKAGTIVLTSASSVLIDGVRDLLLILGIQSRKFHFKSSYTGCGKKFDAWMLGIYDKPNILRFLSKIRLVGDKAKDAIKLKAKVSKRNSNPNWDTIPKDVCSKLGIKDRRLYRRLGFRATQRYCWSRNKLKKAANIEKNPEALRIADSDIFWDEISLIEKIGNDKVVAVEVEGGNYLIDGVITHNTSIISVAHNLWLMINNPDIRILLVSYTLGVAQKIQNELRNHFIHNDDFRYFFKEYAPRKTATGKVDWGTQDEFTLTNRKKILKEPTCMCAGVGTNITGAHYDIINVDDIVNQDSVPPRGSAEMLQVSKDTFSALGNLFDKPLCPRYKVVGTIYHFNDLYHSSKDGLMNNPLFEKSFIPVEKDGVWLFPERFDEEGFNREIRNDKSKTVYDIESQFYLRPFNPADAVFKDVWWNTYEKLPDGLAEYICVDPASTMKKKSDYTVMQRWGIDSEGKHYLLEGFRDRIPTEKRTDRLFDMVSHAKNLKKVSWETIGGRQGDVEMVKVKMLQKQVFFPIEEAKCGKSSKQDRVSQRLTPAFSVGAILFPQNCYYKSEFDGKVYDFIQDYRQEFLQFPSTEHDDILDCHSQMFEEPAKLQKGKKTVEVKARGPQTMAEVEAQYDVIDGIIERYPGMSREQAHEYNQRRSILRLIQRVH